MRNGRHGQSIRERHRKLIAADKPPCHLCNNPIDYELHYLHPDAYTVDHITPINRGGSDTLDNKAAAHRKCNRDKGDKLPGEQPRNQPPQPPRQPTTYYHTDRQW